MLPDKRKKILIAVSAGLAFILVVFLLGKLSSYIKNKNKVIEPRDDSYAEMYDYIGVTVDEDNIYKLYGISEDEEKYLDVKTFYEVEDVIKSNDKIIVYSDAVNELRYDKKEKKFYFYELDSFYSKFTKIKLTEDYIVITNNNEISYRKYGDSDTINIESSRDYLIEESKVYYIKNNKIYVYDMDKEDKKDIVSNEDTDVVSLLAVSNEYLYYLKNNELNVISLKDNTIENLNNMPFYSKSLDGFITKVDNSLANYSLELKDYTYKYELEKDVNKVIYLDENQFYVSFDKEYAIIDLEEGKIWKNLKNEYLYIMKVK